MSGTAPMRPFATRRPRLAFFLFGFLSTAVCGWLLINWLEIARNVFGMQVIYDSRPLWLRLVMTALRALPWAILAVLVAVRVLRGPIVRPLAFAIGAASVYVLAVGSLFFGPIIADLRHRRDFEAVGWRRNDRSNVMWPTRLTMVDGLLANYQLRGMSRDSVEKLLGPRDSTDYWKDWDLVYWLGPERGMLRIDSEWLVLKLGPDGRVNDYQIVRD